MLKLIKSTSLAVVGALLLVLMASVPASAALTWSTPDDLSAATGVALDPQIVSDPSGNLTAIWTGADSHNNIIQAARKEVGGTWGPVADLSASGQNASKPQIVSDPWGNVTAVWLREDANNQTIVQTATRPTTGTWSTPVELSAPGQAASSPQIVSDPSGNLTAIWTRSNGTHYVVQTLSRAFDDTWPSPAAATDLSDPATNANSPQITSDPSGRITAIWTHLESSTFVVQTTTSSSSRTWTDPVTTLSGSGAHANRPQIACDLSGNLTAIWTRYDGSNYIVQTTTKPSGGTWDAVTDLSTPGSDASNPQIVSDPSGNLTAIWTRASDSKDIVQTATKRSGSTWGTPTDLSAPGQYAVAPQIVSDPSGNLTAIWYRNNGSNYIVQTTTQPSGGTWDTSATDLSAPGADASSPQITNDASGNLAAIWIRRNGTNFNSTAQSSTSLPPAPAFTVAFDANGGSGTMAAQTASGTTPLGANTFTRTGYTFTGWNTNANGSGTSYADGAVFDFTTGTTLYAQWTTAPAPSPSATSASALPPGTLAASGNDPSAWALPAGIGVLLLGLGTTLHLTRRRRHA